MAARADRILMSNEPMRALTATGTRCNRIKYSGCPRRLMMERRSLFLQVPGSRVAARHLEAGGTIPLARGN